MKRQNYSFGEELVSEGDPSEAVCLVRDGYVEVIKVDGAHTVVLGHIGPGEFVGEMGVIENLPRSATVRAEGPVTVDWISKQDFLRLVSENSETALKLITRLSERVAYLNLAFAQVLRTGEAADLLGTVAESETDEVNPSQVRIFSDSPDLATEMPHVGAIIDSDTYIVGRKPAEGESGPGYPLDLEITDAMPFRLSREHFAILRTQQSILVRDLESKLGTSVNGVLIGHHFSKDTAALREGDNFIIAGGVDSKFRFRIHC